MKMLSQSSLRAVTGGCDECQGTTEEVTQTTVVPEVVVVTPIVADINGEAVQQAINATLA